MSSPITLTVPLSRPRLPQEKIAPREPPWNQLSRIVNHLSALRAPLFAPPCKASQTSLTGVRRDKWRRDTIDHVFLFELNCRAGGMIGLEAGNSGSFVMYFDRTAIEKDPNTTTSRPFLSYLRRHRLSQIRMGDGHFSVPRNQKVRAAATACIAPALPRRVSSCVDLLSLFSHWRFHLAASLRSRAHGANSNPRKRDSRHQCPLDKPRCYSRCHRPN